jgi:hypothetical protein
MAGRVDHHALDLEPGVTLMGDRPLPLHPGDLERQRPDAVAVVAFGEDVHLTRGGAELDPSLADDQR